MVYEKHAILPKETAYIQKAAAIARNKNMNDYQVKNYLAKAIQAQNERFDQQMSGKDQVIHRQHKVMIA